MVKKECSTCARLIDGRTYNGKDGFCKQCYAYNTKLEEEEQRQYE